jgi:hypothetical protein
VSALAGSIDAARARNYRDPDEEPAALDWGDPVARVAVALHALSYNTPETVGGMVTGEKGREELAYTWSRKHPTDRQLLRRRAAILLEIGAANPVAFQLAWLKMNGNYNPDALVWRVEFERAG